MSSHHASSTPTISQTAVQNRKHVKTPSLKDNMRTGQNLLCTSIMKQEILSITYIKER